MSGFWFSLFFKFQITGQYQIQLCRRLCHEAAALVEDGLFQRVAGETSVARRAGAGELDLFKAKNGDKTNHELRIVEIEFKENLWQ